MVLFKHLTLPAALAALALGAPAAAHAAALGDFNGDGRTDQVVSSSWGTHVIYGGPGGLTTGRPSQLFTGVRAPYAIGDFNGDGRADLAADEASGDDRVRVLFSTANGLAEAGAEVLAPPALQGASFGQALAAGDFDDDGRDDLAISAPFSALPPGNGEAIPGAGVVYIAKGTGPGLATGGYQVVSNRSGGRAEAADHFGWALATGDFNGDGTDDLAVGTPDEDLDGKADVGAISTFDGGGANGVVLSSGRQISQNEGEGIWEPDDRFGTTLAAGDFDGDGRDDLAAGTPDEDLAHGAARDAGAVNVFKGGPSGLRAHSGQQLTQSDAGGLTESYDRFGYALAAGDVDGDGAADLLIGSPYETIRIYLQAGAAHVLFGHAGSGLGRARARTITQGSAGGAVERDDEFGRAVALGDFDGDGDDDVVVGAPYEGVPDFPDMGAINVLKAAAGGSLPPADARQLLLWDAGRLAGGSDTFGAALGSAGQSAGAEGGGAV